MAYTLCLIISRGSKPWFRNELGLADPASSVHLDAGIGVGPIGFVSLCTETFVARELLVAGLGHEIGISVTYVVILCTDKFPS